jgi:hypothetical protein
MVSQIIRIPNDPGQYISSFVSNSEGIAGKKRTRLDFREGKVSVCQMGHSLHRGNAFYAQKTGCVLSP